MSENLKLVDFSSDKSVTQTLANAKDREELFQSVMVIAINKDGSQFLQCSNTSGMEKAFLVGFANAFLNYYFRCEYEGLEPTDE